MSGPGRRRWLRLRGRADVERELDDEIEAHIALRVDDLVRRGETPERARAQALARFGDLEDTRRELHRSARERETELRRRDVVDGLRRDVTIALRQARRSPSFSLLAVITFALGIGSTTAMYTLVDRVLLRPLPFPEAGRLVSLMSVDSAGRTIEVVSEGNWYDWQARNRTLAATAAFMDRPVTVAVGGEAERVSSLLVAGPFFEVIGAPMRAGRPISEDEMTTQAPVAVVSETFWRSRMAGGPLPGAPLRVNGREFVVIGVVDDDMAYPAGTQIWLGYPPRPFTGASRNNINWSAIARLSPGVTVAGARADLDAIAREIRESDPAGIYSWGVFVQPLRDTLTAGAGRTFGLLMGAVVVVLLIACANLAGLGLARAPARMREVALRMALGAGRRRVLRQLVTEVLVLAVVGGMVGVALAWWCVRLLVAHAADRIPRATEVAIDGRAIAFAAVVTVFAGVLAALLPAFRATGGGLRTLIGNDRTTVRGGRGLPGSTLVAGELALALVLLAAGGLLVRSFRKVVDRDLGFDPRGVVTAEVPLSSPDYHDAGRRLVFWRRLLERTNDLPGVEAAGLANWIPTGRGGGSFIEIEGRPESRDGAGYRAVSAGYFDAMGVPLVDGRMFDARDTETSERVAVINRAMAERYWPGRSPLGTRVRAISMESVLEGGAPWITIVGIVGDVRHWGYEADPEPEMYTVFSQVPVHTFALNVVARAPLAMVPRVREALRGEVRSIDPTVAPRIALLDDRVAGLLGERRLTMNVLTGFAVLALLLAAIGVYGLLSFAVAQRTREIGVRAALGAGRAGIIGLVLRSALRVVLAGALAGVFGAWAVTRLMGALLFDISPLDPLAFAAAVFLLLSVSVGAALIPTWRATRVDPLVALRHQ